MPRRHKHKRSKKHILHKKEDIENALEDLRKNNLSYRAAAAKHNIDYTILHRHNTKPDVKKVGGQFVLTPEVENMIVENINICVEWGYPMSHYDLRVLVKAFLDSQEVICKRFKNNMPGADFAAGFAKRHKHEISDRNAENIKQLRATNISSRAINNFFDELEVLLDDVPAENIINYSETNLSDYPARKEVTLKRGSKYPERFPNTTECAISMTLAGTAAGYLLPPYVIYKADQMYDLWKSGGPEKTRYNITATGWMDIVTFEDWITNVILPYTNNMKGTTYLIGDHRSCTLSMDVISICKENDIHLIFLPPHSSHLTQPLDVAYFLLIKITWHDILMMWAKKEICKDMSIPKSIFPRLLKKLFYKIQIGGDEYLQLGFKTTGIVPLNRQEVLTRLQE